jgi:hypothetical protein
MAARTQYSRRAFIKSISGVMVAGPAILVSGCQDSNSVDRELQFASLRTALDEAQRLANAHAETGSTWTLSQTFVHCAQSIEYSLTGFPDMKSELFQHTVGTAAFNVFAWRGRMSHDLAEPIPGAPSLANETDLDGSLARLQKSVEDFERSGEPLQPHFAYGSLSKADYELAHAMHLANHFSVIDA